MNKIFMILSAPLGFFSLSVSAMEPLDGVRLPERQETTQSLVPNDQNNDSMPRIPNRYDFNEERHEFTLQDCEAVLPKRLNFHFMTCMTTIDLSNLGLGDTLRDNPEFLTSLAYCKFLKNLNVSHNDLKENVRALTPLKNLTALNVCHNKLQGYISAVSVLQNLTFLDGSHNGLRQENIAALNSLIKLRFLILRGNVLVGNVSSLRPLSNGGTAIVFSD